VLPLPHPAQKIKRLASLLNPSDKGAFNSISWKMSGIAYKRSLPSWAGSKDGGDDSRKKKHAGISQRAQKGPDFSKLLVIFFASLFTIRGSVFCMCV
jgi:hypothetical protein